MFAQSFLLAALALPFASAKNIDVFVGGSNGLVFTPANVTADVGDTVVFTFGVKNHTVTQSSFPDPCTPLQGGFFSGYMAVSPSFDASDFPQFHVPVKDTKPVWGYCSQTGHCGKGMVFSINAVTDPSGNTFEKFQAAAEATAGTTDTGAGGSTVAPPSAAPVVGAAAADSYGGYGSYDTGASSAASSSTASADTPAATGVTPADNAAASTGTPTVHNVVVGGSTGLVFTPSSVTANPGDIIMFQFQVKNHTVTQSTFPSPCAPKAGGFDSGFMPVAATDTTFPTYNFTVADTTPVWAYCKQATHCQSGMVFSVNAATDPSGNTFDKFQAAAKASTATSSSPSTSASAGSSSSGYGSNGALGNAIGSNGKTMMATLALASVVVGLVL